MGFTNIFFLNLVGLTVTNFCKRFNEDLMERLQLLSLFLIIFSVLVNLSRGETTRANSESEHILIGSNEGYRQLSNSKKIRKLHRSFRVNSTVNA